MIKNIIFTSALLLATAVTGEAMAVCPLAGYTIQNNDTGLRTLLNNTSICAIATVGGEKWHEYHNPIPGIGAGSASFEKIGDGTAVDPNVVIGTLSIVDLAGPGPYYISYAYTGDGTYNYDVYVNGANVELCTQGTANQIATGTLSAGKILTPCP